MIDEYTQSLIHFAGINNATAITDTTGRSWTNSSCLIKTAKSKFGGSSLAFVAPGYIYTAADAVLNLGSNDFCIDFWIYPTLDATYEKILGQGATTSTNISFQVYKLDKNELNFLYWYGGDYAPITTTSSGTLTINSWNHVAVIRNAFDLAIYVNGTTTEHKDMGIYDTIDISTAAFTIGRATVNPASFVDFTGYIDEFRYSNGVPRWTDDFTPPTKPYGSISQRIIMIG